MATRNKVFKTSVTPTVSVSPAYTAGDCVGGKMTFSGVPNSGTIDDVIVLDKGQHAVVLDLFFFEADPANSSLADNAAQAIHANDLPNVVGVAEVAAADYNNSAVNSVATVKNVGLHYKLDQLTASSLYCSAVARSTPTLSTTSDLTIVLHIVADV